MKHFFIWSLSALLLVVLLGACGKKDEESATLLSLVPADTPYVFSANKPLPETLRNKLGRFHAQQLSGYADMLATMRQAQQQSDDPMPPAVITMMKVLEAFFAEFKDSQSEQALAERGIKIGGRYLVYGLGLLPVIHTEITDRTKVEAMLQRIEKRAGVSSTPGKLVNQSYRRATLGEVDLVLATTDEFLILALLPTRLFNEYLPLVLGQQKPQQSLADSGAMVTLLKQYAYPGYGQGYLELRQLVKVFSGRGDGRNAETWKALVEKQPAPSAGCVALAESLIGHLPRYVAGVKTADEQRYSVQGVLETSAIVASRLQTLAAPVPGLGSQENVLLSAGMGLDLPSLRNAIDELLKAFIREGNGCEWVDAEQLRQVMPQLNMVLGPMTAGINGFKMTVHDMQLDSQTRQPSVVKASLLVAVDDPRGVFAMLGMFSPGLAQLDVPGDGSPVALPAELIPPGMPALKVAIKDKTLIVLADDSADKVVTKMVSVPLLDPLPMLSINYGVEHLVSRFADVMMQTAAQLQQGGQRDEAQAIREQLKTFEQQAALFERINVSMYANDSGLVVEQQMILR